MGWKLPGEWTAESTNLGACVIFKTEVQSNEPTFVFTRSFVYMLQLLECFFFCGTPNVGVDVSLTPFPALGTLFLLLGCLIQL